MGMTQPYWVYARKGAETMEKTPTTTLTKRQELHERAKAARLEIHCWSPGDGFTRYRFFPVSAPGVRQSYFGPENGIATVRGLSAAIAWLDTYTAGLGVAAKDGVK